MTGVSFKYGGETVTEAEFYITLIRVESYLTTIQGDDITMEIVDIYDCPPERMRLI